MEDIGTHITVMISTWLSVKVEAWNDLRGCRDVFQITYKKLSSLESGFQHFVLKEIYGNIYIRSQMSMLLP